MSELRQEGDRRRASPIRRPRRYLAALDLGTNNCRLLVAEVRGGRYRIVDSFSQIVRLGEGLSQTGRLSEPAMQRTLLALKDCSRKIAAYPGARVWGVATQACRAAANGTSFLAAVQRDTGLALKVVTPEEEARLSVAGCAALVDPDSQAAIVVDIGGGSTELAWIRPRPNDLPEMLAWASMDLGVVMLADRFPEPPDGREAWYAAMVAFARDCLRGASAPSEPTRSLFVSGRAHLIGTSGAVSSLAGIHLNLVRYQRTRVDGLWMTREEVSKAAAKVLRFTVAERAAHPCIGADRADLIAPGAAILEAVCQEWPLKRVRVADRGLREGMLETMMREAGS